MSAQVKKASKSKTASSHPTYKEMVAAAVTTLKERTGSSRQAIQKYIIDNYTVSKSAIKPNLKKALDSLIKSGELVHPKTHGGSYKLAPSAKAKKSQAKKPKKTVVKKAKTTPKKTIAKKPKAKKTATKKTTTVKKAAKKTPKKAAKKPAAKKSPKKKAVKKTVKKAKK